VEFSDGTTLAGNISLTPGSELKLHAGNQLRSFALDQVQELRMAPEKEEMAQGYRFPEAGKAIKQPEGQPYPVRHLNTTLVLAGGATITGHLYTTVLYVESEGTARKLILLAKQRGKEGDTMRSLLYPTRVRFNDAAAKGVTLTRLRLATPGLGAVGELVALSRGPLDRMEASPAAVAGEYLVPPSFGGDAFLAVRSGQKIVVGWPEPSDAPLAALVRTSLTESEDFFDDRKVLGVWRDATNSAVYSLILAARKGATTLPGSRSQPWRLEVYRWKQDGAAQRLMLAGRGYFFRDIGGKNEAVPPVQLSAKLWRMRRDGDTWVAGAE
jgi:hypothetical protein